MAKLSLHFCHRRQAFAYKIPNNRSVNNINNDNDDEPKAYVNVVIDVSALCFVCTPVIAIPAVNRANTITDKKNELNPTKSEQQKPQPDSLRSNLPSFFPQVISQATTVTAFGSINSKTELPCTASPHTHTSQMPNPKYAMAQSTTVRRRRPIELEEWKDFIFGERSKFKLIKMCTVYNWWL